MSWRVGEGERRFAAAETEVGYRMLSKMSIRPKDVVYDSVKKENKREVEASA
jgi:hypothetical protein